MTTISLRTFLEKMHGIDFVCISTSNGWAYDCDITEVDSIPQELLERVVDRADFVIFNGNDDLQYISVKIRLF